MASATPSESVDSELRCSICLGTFVCPSTLNCGHSFCLRCLEAAWETTRRFSCPQCRATFPLRPQLRRNVALANLAEQLRVGDGMAAAVVCDHCSGGQTLAVKTCLRCEMSYCARHARPHLENPRLSDHVLVAPIANLEGRRCRQHRHEQIKFYCEQDESLVCTVCTIAGEHRGHEVIPVENAQQTKQEAFRLVKTGREEKKTTAESWTQQLKGAYKHVQESLRGTKARISREFERRREQLREEEKEALERVDEEGRSVLSRIQADIARYESRARGLEQEINQLLAALAVQDPLSFLQDPLHESLRNSVSQETQDDPASVSNGLNLAQVISVGGVQTKLLPFLDGRSPTLDTNSTYDRLQISSDLRTVTLSGVLHGRPHHSHHFECWNQALCSQSFSSGQHYWEVDVGSAWRCRVGVAHGTIPRRGRVAECGLGGSDVSWCLQKDGASFSVLHGGIETSLSVPEPPRRVGVHLDWDAGLLSFYSADSMAQLHSFHQNFTQPLHPGLGVWGKVGESVRIVDLSGVS
ncbi:E3 ubiquitin-protein ligase TRIM21-like [Lethenteron reissneri]|uniref:E3 ubiquitin-protein ligase TRIM21-like n=1 Tax=Lethenteron reissneri TaxID=7753 RepID=UPI002AB67D90|nr:E3 ubiquitin-protein ligase TRIM21-like [Lethenteron reissneri]